MLHASVSDTRDHVSVNLSLCHVGKHSTITTHTSRAYTINHVLSIKVLLPCPFHSLKKVTFKGKWLIQSNALKTPIV